MLERKMMGEKRNLAFRLGKFVRDAAHDTALGQAYKRVAENTNHVRDLSGVVDEVDRANARQNLLDDGWVKVDDTLIGGTQVKKYGMLAGKWVSPDADRIIRAMASQRYQSETRRATKELISRSTRLWKIGKTAFNPKTHGYNWLANLHMSVMGGYNPIELLIRGGRNLAKKGDTYNRAVNAGMLDSNVLRGELDMGKFLIEMEKIEQGSVIDDSMSLLKTMAKYGRQKGKKALYKALRTYEIGDEIFKLGVFSKQLGKGLDDQAAIKEANKWFFDYRDIPPGVAQIRDWGLMPFVSYTYKALPAVIGSIANHPHRVLGILWFYSMLNEAMYGFDYGKDAAKQQAYERAALPEHMREDTIFPGGPHGNVRMSKRMLNKVGMGANEGQAPYLSSSHGVPLGDFFSEGGMWGSYPFSFHPGISILGAAVSGKDMRFDKDIGMQEPVTEQDKTDKAMAMMGFVSRTLFPNLPFIPGQYSPEKMGNAATSAGIIPPDIANAAGWTGKDRFGGEVSLPKAAFSMFGLLNFREPYPAEEMDFEKRKKVGTIYDAKRKVKYGILDERTTEREQAKLDQNLDATVDVQVDEIDRLNTLAEQAPDENLLKYSRQRR